jgi:transposase
MEVRDTCAHALPKTTSPHLDTWYLDEAHARITLLITSAQAAPRCPGCKVPARCLHSHDTSTRAALPWRGDSMTWRLRVRQLFCHHRPCPRRTFTERRPSLVAPWARRTLRWAARLLAIGLALGGAAGARLRQSFGLSVSRNTLLRLIRRAPCPEILPPQVLSVEEFALRQRHPDGTLLVDRTRRRPRARLPGREAASVAQWLAAHPGVAVVVRERAEA